MQRPPPLLDEVPAQRPRRSGRRSGRDNAPLIAAEALLRHGLTDDRIVMHLVAVWRLPESEAQDAVLAAHVLLRRERFDASA